MTTVYVDTSSWGKLLKEETESRAFAEYVDAGLDAGDHFVSSALLVTETFRLAERLGIAGPLVTAALSQVDIFLPELSVYRAAGLLPGANLRSLDALHVAHCLAIEADVLATYDDRQIEAAQAAGIRTVSPRPKKAAHRTAPRKRSGR